MKNSKEFPFNTARRITTDEVKAAKRAIEKMTGKKRVSRGRPPKTLSEKYKAISIRIHPKILAWAKKEAKRRHVGYQTIINEALFKTAA